jgi:hypothetical protein
VSRCIPTDAQAITLGVDTHKDVHVAVALDGIGLELSPGPDVPGSPGEVAPSRSIMRKMCILYGWGMQGS